MKTGIMLLIEFDEASTKRVEDRESKIDDSGINVSILDPLLARRWHIQVGQQRFNIDPIGNAFGCLVVS